MEGTKIMKILVTGGAGFIGSAVIRQILLETDFDIINIDKLTYAGNLESLPGTESIVRYNFERCDICDEKAVAEVFAKYKPQVVMHLAAESHVDRSIDGPGEFIKTNIIGTFCLLEQARLYFAGLDGSEKDNFRFHHISTDEVFGDLVGTDNYFIESTPYAPSSPYSASKASSDHLVRAWGRTYGLPIIITNCSNNYGPYHFPEKLVPHTILNGLAGKPMPIYGDGSQIRDWLYVEDHAKALLKVVANGKLGETYMLGGGNEKTNMEVVCLICDLLDEFIAEKPNDIDSFRDLISFVEDRPGHDGRYAIDATKMREELCWSPDETFESGMRKTVQWYINNRGWWERIMSGDYSLGRIGSI